MSDSVAFGVGDATHLHRAIRDGDAFRTVESEKAGLPNRDEAKRMQEWKIPRTVALIRPQNIVCRRSRAFLVAALFVTGACSNDDLTGPPPRPYDPTDIEVTPLVAISDIPLNARFLVRNRTRLTIRTDACATALELRVLGRWIPLRRGVACEAMLLQAPPDGYLILSFPLDAEPPSGQYRVRVRIREVQGVSGPFPDQFSTAFRISKSLPRPDLLNSP